jgi:ubiquinol-cytochrome c reductase cytochrome c1 subunit
MKNLLRSLLLAPVLALCLSPVFGNEAGYPLERAPDQSRDLSALQNGAKLFVNYCLNCHSMSSMRYNRMRDIGLTEDQIRQNFVFGSAKVGDTMTVSLNPKDAKAFFGVAPPDLSVIARARSSAQGSGADWLYTYLRTFYKDETRATGWNNLVLPNVAMPHVLWQLQGVNIAKYAEKADPHNEGKMLHAFEGFEQASPGTLGKVEYDHAVADLVSFLSYVSEPSQTTRKQLGVWVLLFLGLLFVITWRLNASFWKDIK